MSVTILQAILKIFAAIAAIDGVADEEREVIKKYLEDHFNEQMAEEYLQEFERYSKNVGLTEVVIQEVCKSLNSELSLIQKIVIVLRVAELVKSDGVITPKEQHYLNTICKSFNIAVEHQREIEDFVNLHRQHLIAHPNVLTIDSVESKSEVRQMQMLHPGLKAELSVIKLSNEEIYLIKLLSVCTDIYLFEERLKPGICYPLMEGSVIKSTGMQPIYYSQILRAFKANQGKREILFEAHHVNYTFEDGTQGLRDINIAEEGGNLVAIMGASGSGKSTLLNVLNGEYKPTEGQVLLNGIDIHQNPKLVKGVIGYVPQDDLLIENLTVYDNLYYAAKLSFGEDDEATIHIKVEKTLKSLNLWEARHLQVGNVLNKTLSGGQKKRLNIALELIREPMVMFVDEPTSGLSSKDSEKIMHLLRDLAISGKLIFVVIHQPSSDIFKKFDKLFIMDTGGFPIYYGNPVESLIYFKEHINLIDKERGACETCGNLNPEQLFDIIETRIVNEYGYPTNERRYPPRVWWNYFKHKFKPEVKKKTLEPLPSLLKVPGWFRQFWVFLKRDFYSKWNNRQYMVTNLLVAPTLAMILAFVTRFYHVDEAEKSGLYHFIDNMNVPAFLFMGVIVSLFVGLTVSAEQIIKDAKILKREKFLSLNRNSYLVSKVVIMFGFSAIQMLLYVLIGNAIIGIKGMTAMHWMVLFSSACFANLLGLNISASIKQVENIYITIPIMLIPQLILGGVIVKYENMNPNFTKQGSVPFIGDLMASRWAYEALAVGQFMNNPYGKTFYQVEKEIAEAQFKIIYYLPELNNKLAICQTTLNKKNENEPYNSANFESALRLLKNEISKEQMLTPQIPTPDISKLVAESFDFKMEFELEKYFENLEKHYRQAEKRYLKLKDLTIDYLIEKIGKKEFLKLKEDYTNDALTKLVRQENEENRIIEYRGRLIRKFDQVYHEPLFPKHLFDYRTHYYAPKKHFLGQYFSTLNFNIGVLWLMTLLLYISLYFNFFEVIFRSLQSIWFFIVRKKA
jgi:ABC-type multidrug transport system ATPase subunit/predicted nucleic acid-binding protein